MSLEQTPEFIVLRRLLRAVAPTYVLFTNAELKPGESEVRLEQESIIISDHTPLESAIPLVLFQIGVVHARKDVPATGRGTTEAEILRGVARSFAHRDTSARDWAIKALGLFWPESDSKAAYDLLSKTVRTPNQWLAILSRDF